MISIIFLSLLILFLIFILIKQINFKNNYIICFLITLFIIIFIININTSLNAVIEGLNLCFNAIIPTVFPFSVICNLLICYDGISIYSRYLGNLFCKPLNLSKNCSFPIIASLICGYPLGAKYCSDIYKLGYINRDEYIRLLNIATNCGPIFILGVIGTSFFSNIEIGYLLLIANYLSVFIVGLLSRRSSRPTVNSVMQIKKSSKSFGDNLKYSIENAINTTLSITGFIVVFTILINLLKDNHQINILIYNLESSINLPTGVLYSLFLGSIEITNGCSSIYNSIFETPLKLALISFLCSFSGLSIIAQASSFISPFGVSIKKYSLLKLLQGLISFLITYFIANLYRGSIETFSSFMSLSAPPKTYIFLIPCFIMLTVYLLMYTFKKLFFHTS